MDEEEGEESSDGHDESFDPGEDFVFENRWDLDLESDEDIWKEDERKRNGQKSRTKRKRTRPKGL